MSNESEIRIVIGSKRYAGNSDKDVWIQPPLIGDRRELIEGDRSILVNQQNIFEKERQGSNTFRVILLRVKLHTPLLRIIYIILMR